MLRNFWPVLTLDAIDRWWFMLIAAGHPTWQDERDKKQVRPLAPLQRILVVTKDGAPAEEGHYKANVDV
jgi:hypothetical protein